MNTFKEIEGRLVPITTEFVYPPIPYRGNDWCAHYSADQSDCPDYGWGASAEAAIQDLIDSYDDPEAPITFEGEYECDLIADRLQVTAYAYLYYQQFALLR
jgi:hypothetical protein